MPTEQGVAAGPAATRIKRNSACTACRDAKVRCNPSSNAGQPCQRCGKLNIKCMVDKTHKRMSRKSKIDELVQEIQTIKQTVGGQLPQYIPTPFKEPGVPRLGMPSPVMSRPTVSSNTTTVSAINTPAKTLTSDPNIEPSLPRALASQPFSGEDIDFYFQKYFECFHPYMPIVRHRDPNKCYETGSLLFWTIILVACRRYARDSVTLPFLMDAVRRELFTTITNLPLTIHSINALILVCTWSFSDVRFINDPASIFSGVIMNSALLLGIHTGKGSHREFSFGTFQNNFTDEEAVYTWAGYNIATQRISAYMGIPPNGGLFNQAVQNLIDGRFPFQVPSNFRVLLECQKFSNHVTKTMAICLDGARGVSSHIVMHLEDEFDAIRGLICSERADDFDRYNALLVQQEIQIYYLMPLPGYDSEQLKRNILRAYTTARAVIRTAKELDEKHDFMRHLPQFYFRTLISASCIVYMVLRSCYMEFIDRNQMETSISEAISICRGCTIQEGDLPMRLGNLLESFWGLSKVATWQEEPVSGCSQRLGASINFDCLRKWKEDMNGARPRSQLTPAQGDETTAVPIGDDPMANIDWSFMDDFDWNFEPTLFPPIT